mgnify:CR=1 FL=1|jgi:hypothetical protein
MRVAASQSRGFTTRHADDDGQPDSHGVPRSPLVLAPPRFRFRPPAFVCAQETSIAGASPASPSLCAETSLDEKASRNIW